MARSGVAFIGLIIPTPVGAAAATTVAVEMLMTAAVKIDLTFMICPLWRFRIETEFT